MRNAFESCLALGVAVACGQLLLARGRDVLGFLRGDAKRGAIGRWFGQELVGDTGRGTFADWRIADQQVAIAGRLVRANSSL